MLTVAGFINSMNLLFVLWAFTEQTAGYYLFLADGLSYDSIIFNVLWNQLVPATLLTWYLCLPHQLRKNNGRGPSYFYSCWTCECCWCCGGSCRNEGSCCGTNSAMVKYCCKPGDLWAGAVSTGCCLPIGLITWVNVYRRPDDPDVWVFFAIYNLFAYAVLRVVGLTWKCGAAKWMSKQLIYEGAADGRINGEHALV